MRVLSEERNINQLIDDSMCRIDACFSKDEIRSVLEILVTNILKSQLVEAAVLEAQGKQKPVGKPHRWNDDGERCLDCGDKDWMADKYCSAAPVVQPDMVMVPREATEAMLDAAMNRYKHVSPEAKARYTQMHRENFRCDYRAMIAACEDKS